MALPLSLLLLVTASYLLSARFYTSASFERPLVFAPLTLLFSAISFHLVKTNRPTNHDTRYSPLGGLAGPCTARHLGSLPIFPLQIIAYATLRAALFWVSLRWTQCGWFTLQPLVPFLIFAFDLVQAASVLTTKRRAPSPTTGTTGTTTTVAYAILTLAWSSASICLSRGNLERMGTPCPADSTAWMVPTAQVIGALLDAHLLRLLSHHRGQTETYAALYRNLLLISSVLVAIVAILLTSLYGTPLPGFQFHQADVRDLLADSGVAAVAILNVCSLSATLHPATIAMAIISSSLVATHPRPLNADLARRFLEMGLALIWILIPYRPLASPTATSGDRPQQTVVGGGGSKIFGPFRYAFALLLLCGLADTIFKPLPHPQLSLPQAVHKLTTSASRDQKQWLATASSSQNLADATFVYQQRYGIPPPKGFDKWHAFATEHKSPIIDVFDQIDRDLYPFWALEPAVLRALTKSLLQSRNAGLGGLRIANGQVQAADNIPGTHRWMADAISDMMAPFAKWLPDMDIVLNLADEPRMAVPFETMELLRMDATAARAQANEADPSKTSSETISPAWPSRLPQPSDVPKGAEGPSHFGNHRQRALFYSHVAESCGPETSARQSRWWSWSALCVDCAAPHSLLTTEGLIVVNASLAMDPCHQPDLAYLHGMASCPSYMRDTRELLPIFSQGRLGGFSDILIPSPWNFRDKTVYKDTEDPAREWKKKKNDMYWRGSSTDGFAAHGSWAGFARTRFVAEAQEEGRRYAQGLLSSSSSSSTLSPPDMSFAGRLFKCDTEECQSEVDTFYPWYKSSKLAAGQEPAAKPDGFEMPSEPVTENWRHRHLIDLDGAGFSGRFIPFLQSRSLVYRVTMVQTWLDERVHAWHHYVPGDVRGGEGFWALLRYFGGMSDTSSSAKRGDVAGGDDQRVVMVNGNEDAQRIAMQGRKWALRALRKEDMQIYLFRLLLEWGRLVSDDRESMVYEHGGST